MTENTLPFIIGVFITILLFEYCFWVFRKKWKVRKKIIVAVCGTFVLTIFLSLVFSKIQITFFQNLPENLQNRFIVISLMVHLVTSFIVILSTETIASVIRNQLVLLENQKLAAENIKNRYQVLKNQLNPHFLFNSLNTLIGIIELDNDKAKEYVEQFSLVFRYSIQNKEITTLDEEVAFTEAFCNLMRIRYGQSLIIECRINSRYRSRLIMPLSLQTLVENAIKHNTVSNRYPLTITIETTDNGTIRVSNKIQPKSEDTSGEGIGLENMNERYKLMYQQEITISATDGIFCVEIPLIPPKEGRSAAIK
jgi:LytS/YehU family sensor histidine kinase